MDELRRPGRVDHGHAGLAPDDLLGRDRHAPHRDRGDPPRPGHDVHPPLRHVARVPRQDVAHGPGVGAPGGRAAGGAEEGVAQPQHVRPVPDIQAADEPPLQDMQQMREPDGPSLPLDEQ